MYEIKGISIQSCQINNRTAIERQTAEEEKKRAKNQQTENSNRNALKH